MKDTDAAYLAGLIDGEGSVMVRVRQAAYNPRVTPHLEVSLTEREALDWALGVTGVGRFYTLTPPKNPNAAQSYRWVVYNQQFRSVATATLPFLILKKEQMEVAVQILDLRLQYRRGHAHSAREQVLLAARLRSLRHSQRAVPLDPDSFTYGEPPTLTRGPGGRFDQGSYGRTAVDLIEAGLCTPA